MAVLERARAVPEALRPGRLAGSRVRLAVFFAVQMGIIIGLDSLNDVLRGNVWKASRSLALLHAHQIVDLESALGFYLEPRIQTFFQQRHHALGLTITWPIIERIANGIYGYCHILIPLFVFIWLFVRHRAVFRRVRNIILVADALAFVGYLIYPTAPPWLTTGLTYKHHPFHFQDTMQHTVGGIMLNGAPLGYNPYAAIPSVHIIWSVLMGASLILVARPLPMRIFGAVYPFIILFAIVVTANHWIMDAVTGVITLGIASGLVFIVEAWWNRRERPRSSVAG